MLRLVSLALLLEAASAGPSQGKQLRGPKHQADKARRLQNQYVYVDGPRVGNTAWKGPGWPNVQNCYWYEVGDKFNWEEARAFCDAYENCTIMHDYMCDEKNWRYCRVELSDLVAVSPRSQGCTRIKIPMTLTETSTTGSATEFTTTVITTTITSLTTTTSTLTTKTSTSTNTGTKTTTSTTTLTTATTTATKTTTTTITTTTTPLTTYVDCPRVANTAWTDFCVADTYTLDEAKAKCNQDPLCHYLHDYNCDGRKWRYCHGHVTEIQNVTPDESACTKCAIKPSIFVDGPAVANPAWEEGNCHEWTGSRYEAEQKCLDMYPNCTVIHDYGCNDALWRYCQVPLNVIEAVEGTGACTRIISFPTTTTTTTTLTVSATPTTTTTTTTSSMNYYEGPHVNPRAWRKHCYATLYATLEEAVTACELDSDCSVLFDWGCDRKHFRICHSDIDAIWEEGPGDACTHVAAAPVTPSNFKDGPMVSNEAWHTMCSEWTGTLEEAILYCNMMPGCNTLHDFDCDGWSYRYCWVNTKALVMRGEELEDRMACTRERAHGKKPTYREGPHVHNRAQKVHCNQSWFGTLEEAELMCDMDATCTVLHDWGCDGVNWRFCFSDLRAIQTEYIGNNDACTMIAPMFVSSGRVSSCAYTHCSEWTGSRQEAEDRCIAEVTCKAVFDYACDGLGWRTCDVTVEELMADTCKEDAIAASYAHAQAQANCGAAGCITTTCPPPVADACVMPLRAYATTTSTTTMCSQGIFFMEGPRVANTAYVEHCSEWYGTYAEAMQFCRCNPSCMGLHDWSCDATNWRWCETSLDVLANTTNGTDACTKVVGTSTSTTTITVTTTTTTATTVTTTGTTVTATKTTTTKTTTSTSTTTTATTTTATTSTETTATTTTVTTVSTTSVTTTTHTDTSHTSTETFYTTTTTSLTSSTHTETTHTTVTTTHTTVTDTETTHTTTNTDTTVSTTTHISTTETDTTATTTQTLTSTLFYYEEGPAAGNTVWKGPLSGPPNCFWFSDDPMFNLAAAQAECNKYTNCTALHDFLGDDINWRFCRVPIETLVAETRPAMSLGRTMLKQPASSRCSADPSCSR